MRFTKHTGIFLLSIVVAGTLFLVGGGSGINYPDATPVTFVVVASDAPARMKVRGPGRYICTATACDVEIQAAVTAIEALGTTAGVIELSPGSFNIAATIQLSDNIVLRGGGIGVTTITAANALNEPMLTNKEYAEGGSENSNITVQGITFDHDRANQNSASGGGRWAISDTYGNSAAIWFKEVSRVRVIGCEVLNASRAAICFCQCNDATVSGCRIDNSNDDGVAIDDACNLAVVSGNTMTDVGKSNDYGAPAGVEVQDGAHEVTVSGNAISCSTTHGSAKPDGISLNAHTSHGTGPFNVSIVGNTILNGVSGIKLTAQSDVAALYPRDVTISANTIRSDTNIGIAHYGIMLAYGKSITVTGNNIRKDESGFAGYGIRLDAVSDFEVANNIATVLSGGANASDVAMYVGAPVLTRGTIKDNTFTDWTYCYFQIGVTGAVTLTDVVIGRNTLSSPNVATPRMARWFDDAGGTFSRCVWDKQHLAEVIAASAIHWTHASSNFGNSKWEQDRVFLSSTDSGDGNPGTLAIPANKRYVEMTGVDSDGNTITIGETDAQEGWECTIVNVGAETCSFTDSAGVLELSASPYNMGTDDSLTLRYANAQWVETSRSNN
jgi:hypothetical protein